MTETWIDIEVLNYILSPLQTNFFKLNYSFKGF
jgi:hypothetical protein